MTEFLKYEGVLNIPGVDDPMQIFATIDVANNEVSIELEESEGLLSRWKCSNVEIARRTKYHEIVFMTQNLPIETVELTWKFNASLTDRSLAGVIVPKPNKLRVAGEKGFILNRVS